MPTWLTPIILEAIKDAPTVIDGLAVFLQHMHNEMKHGQGQTQPVGVVEAAIDNIDDLAVALSTVDPKAQKAAVAESAGQPSGSQTNAS